MPWDLPLQFDRPGWLLVLLLLVPTYLMTRRSIGGLSRTKAYATFALRAVVILLLTASLARPIWEKRGEGLTVTLIIDRSQSIPLALKQYSLDFLREASETGRKTDDRVAVITVGKDAVIATMPDPFSAVPDVLPDPADLNATNLAALHAYQRLGFVQTQLRRRPKPTIESELGLIEHLPRTVQAVEFAN